MSGAENLEGFIKGQVGQGVTGDNGFSGTPQISRRGQS